MSTTELEASLEFMKTKLTANATLVSLATGGFHRSAAPVGAVPPFVIFAYQSGHDTLTFNANRVLSHLLFQVKAVGPVSMMTVIWQMAALIDDVLKKTAGTATGTKIDGYFREEPLMYDEVRPDGSRWTYCGGLYRSIAEQV
jgi:hypothetical protein